MEVAETTGMPTKLKRLILFIVRNLDRELGSIELAKLAYLTDIEKMRFVGQSITGEEYVRRDFGPLARNFQDAIRSMLNHEVIRSYAVSGGWSGMTKFCHRPGPNPRFDHELDPIDEAIARRALAKYGHLSPIQLERRAYDTEPMKLPELKKGDVLDLELVERDERALRWRRNKTHQLREKDPEYEAFLAEERQEIEKLQGLIQ